MTHMTQLQHHSLFFFLYVGLAIEPASGSIHWELIGKMRHVVCGAHDRNNPGALHYGHSKWAELTQSLLVNQQKTHF